MALKSLYTALVYAAVAAMFVFGLGPLLWDAWQDRQLQSDGLRSRAEVLSITDTRSRVNGNPVVELRLRIGTETGAPYEATLRAPISPVDLPRVQPGLKVDVMVHRDDRLRVALARAP
jgi:hypothetical protein